MINEGKSDIDQAFSLDTKREIREITIHDLVNIGEFAFSYDDGYIMQGYSSKGLDYKIFSVEVLKLAFAYDRSNKTIALKISDHANKLGDKVTAEKYSSLDSR